MKLFIQDKSLIAQLGLTRANFHYDSENHHQSYPVGPQSRAFNESRALQRGKLIRKRVDYHYFSALPQAEDRCCINERRGRQSLF